MMPSWPERSLPCSPTLTQLKGNGPVNRLRQLSVKRHGRHRQEAGSPTVFQMFRLAYLGSHCSRKAASWDGQC